MNYALSKIRNMIFTYNNGNHCSEACAYYNCDKNLRSNDPQKVYTNEICKLFFSSLEADYGLNRVGIPIRLELCKELFSDDSM